MRIRALVVAALVAATAPAFPQLAFAESKGQVAEAQSHHRRGVELFNEADFRAALIEFRRAHELSPNYRVLYNLGQCQLELQDYAGALQSYRRYLDGGGKEIEKTRRAQVEATVKKLQSRVATVEIRTNVPGAEVHVDDEVVGQSPLEAPVLVSAGRRRFVVEKAGRPTATKTLDVVGGDRVVVNLPLEEPRPGATTPEPAPKEQPGPEPKSEPKPLTSGEKDAPPPKSGSSVWIGWVATGVLAAGAVTTGVIALGAKSDRDKRIGEFPGDAAAIDDANSRARTFSLVTDIVTGAAVVAFGVTLYFTLRSPSRPTASATPTRIGIGPGRLLLEGAF